VEPLPERIVRALEPYVGRMAADTCMRASALSIGKMSTELSVEDLPDVRENIERMLSSVASKTTVAGILSDIERGAA
jgi:hypothetical protein